MHSSFGHLQSPGLISSVACSRYASQPSCCSLPSTLGNSSLPHIHQVPWVLSTPGPCPEHRLNISFFFQLRKNMHPRKFPIAKYPVQWHQLHSQCCVTITTNPTTFSSLQTQTQQHIINLPPASMDWTILNISYIWNHIICDILCLSYFTYGNVFRVHPCHMYQHLNSFPCLNHILLYGNILLIHSSLF